MTRLTDTAAMAYPTALQEAFMEALPSSSDDTLEHPEPPLTEDGKIKIEDLVKVCISRRSPLRFRLTAS